jgi:EamA-like transporter family.
MNYYFGIGLTILSNLLYHILQKSIPGSVNPIGSLIVTYLTAAAACVLLFPLIPGQTPMMAAFKGINWASAALGLAIIGLEAGFLMAYRAGWQISLAAGISNVIVSALLVFVGLFFYREHLNPQNITGVVLCLIGLILIQQK